MSTRGLNHKQKKFISEFILDQHATKAAIRAGYSANSAYVQGPRLLENAKIKEEIDAAMERRNNRVEIKAEDILRELLTFARLDIGKAFGPDGSLLPVKEMPEDVRRAISSVEVEELFKGQGSGREQVGLTRKVKFWDKPRGLELLGKHLKIWIDRVEHSADKSLEQLIRESYQVKP